MQITPKLCYFLPQDYFLIGLMLKSFQQCTRSTKAFFQISGTENTNMSVSLYVFSKHMVLLSRWSERHFTPHPPCLARIPWIIKLSLSVSSSLSLNWNELDTSFKSSFMAKTPKGNVLVPLQHQANFPSCKSLPSHKSSVPWIVLLWWLHFFHIHTCPDRHLMLVDVATVLKNYSVYTV